MDKTEKDEIIDRISEIRTLNNQENELINQRFTWMFVIEGLIVNAYIMLIGKTDNLHLHILRILCMLGIFITISFCFSFSVSRKALDNLKKRYRELILRLGEKDESKYPLAIGLYTKYDDLKDEYKFMKHRILDPWVVLPVIFLIFWGFLFVLSFFSYYIFC